MSAAELIGTGILMGTLHVLTGPDHLSALATLSSTDLSSRAKRDQEQGIEPQNFDCRAFLLGVRWGVGHSVGLLVVGGILIGIQEGTTSGEWIGLNNWVTNMLETFVGIFMIGLGCYGAMKALANREYVRNTNQASLGGKMRRNSRSMGTCSSGEGTMPSDNKTKNNRAAVKNNLVVTGGIELPVHGGRDSIVDQMSSALNTRSSEIDKMWGEDEDGKNMSDSDRRLWIATKSFTQNMNMYASDDDVSCGKSRSDSVVTIPMSGLMMDDLQRMYENADESNLNRSLTLNDSHRHVSMLFDDFDTADDDDTIPRGSNHMQFTVPTAFGDGNMGSSDCNVVSVRKRRYIFCKYFVCTPSVLALMAGLVHGVAGPGGVLGIIPAVQMQDVGLAITYLGTFCITSTLVMGCFAAFYGRMCYWMADGDDKDKDSRVNRIFVVEFGSACLSIIVGIVWLTLLAAGELNEVFP